MADSTLVKQHAQTILKHSKLRRLRSLGEFLEKAIEAGDAPQAIEASLMKRLQFLEAGLDLEGKVLPDSRIRAKTLTAVSAEDLLAMEIKPREMLLDPILPEQGLAMLYGIEGEDLLDPRYRAGSCAWRRFSPVACTPATNSFVC